MKKGDIVCIQFQVWPRPKYGVEWKPLTRFYSPDKLFYGRPFTKTPSFPIAGWRIKSLKK